MHNAIPPIASLVRKGLSVIGAKLLPGYIKLGNPIVPPDAVLLDDFRPGLARVRLPDGTWTYMDKSGEGADDSEPGSREDMGLTLTDELLAELQGQRIDHDGEGVHRDEQSDQPTNAELQGGQTDQPTNAELQGG